MLPAEPTRRSLRAGNDDGYEVPVDPGNSYIEPLEELLTDVEDDSDSIEYEGPEILSVDKYL